MVVFVAVVRTHDVKTTPRHGANDACKHGINPMIVIVHVHIVAQSYAGIPRGATYAFCEGTT